MALFDRALVRVLPAVPRPVVRRLSSRYIAGSELADALAVVRELNDAGKLATLDVLGEETATPEEALAIRSAYEEAIAEIEAQGLDANVSVKLTGLGLEVDPALCAENVRVLVRAAAGQGRFVRIDMEDSSTTTATLDLYRELRAEGHENVGVVLQAMLRRTMDDVHELLPLRPNVRVCKGIYLEPPALAYQGADTVRFNFVEAVAALLDGGCKTAIATHDDWVIAESLALIAERGLGPERYEFQMLLGVREELADELVREGHTVRIYVPYGRRWYEYSLRRLQENPKMAGQVALAALRRLRP
ncbi:MAG TPA: proline dehydrogenase family protein [Gaiellaceae bacterium]|nr:proline dehydrogenase family protein [Gaiellaceae bacterium]